MLLFPLGVCTLRPFPFSYLRVAAYITTCKGQATLGIKHRASGVKHQAFSHSLHQVSSFFRIERQVVLLAYCRLFCPVAKMKFNIEWVVVFASSSGFDAVDIDNFNLKTQ